MLRRIINRLRLFLPSKPRQVFTRIYKKNSWGSKESVSGPGSTLEATAEIRAQLPLLFKNLHIKILLDAPCGDFNWMSRVDLSGIDYTGADIVPEIIEKNTTKFPGKKFIVLDITAGPVPYADLVLCKDCFIHLRNQDVKKVISNFKNSGSKYMLASTYPVNSNKVILTGHYRPVNLQKPPFNLPEPIQMIRDFTGDGTEKYLALWDLETVRV